jgi:serine/threonine protein kinase
MNDYPDFSQYNYQIVRELGRNREGGRISYLAIQLDSGQQVAIKQFRFLQEASWQGFKAYEREVAILQELNHPRIPRYLNSFETNDGFCMVQEYRDAPSLVLCQLINDRLSGKIGSNAIAIY